MPWNNQSGGGGGWKSGGGNNGGPWGQGPWGQGGGSGGGGQPDLEDILKRSQDKMKQVMHGGGGLPGPLVFLAAILAAAAVAWYAFFFRVNPDELGVVMRFGQFVRQEPPGLHFRLPYPIEEVRLPKVTVQQTIEIGMRGGSRTGSSEGSLMLTGDGNVVDVRFVVYWRIKPEAVGDYLFNIQNPEITVREVAESAMREVVGQSNLQPLLTEGRAKAQADVQKLMQSILDYYGAGVRIDQVQLREVDPPAQVISAFRDVQSAGQDKDRYIKEAQTYADQVVPRAKGEADRILAAAQGYKDQTVAEAVGQTARFLKVYEEYKKAPDVTRERLFLEMQEKVLTGTDKIILDGKNGGSGVVPYLPLDQLQKKPATTTEGGN
jgi:membrane protease subunit HflK